MYQYQDFRNAPSMYMMGMPQQYYPMIQMPNQQMERMYPKVYHMVNDAVKHQCDMMEMNYGPMHTPTNDEVESMTDNIHNNLGPQVEDMDEYKEDMQQDMQQERQFGHGGRRLLRDLIKIFLIRELLRRRQGHGMHFGSFGY